MILSKTTTTEQFRQAFQQAFPLLDLKFYRRSHDHFKGSKREDEIGEEVALTKLNPALPLELLPLEKEMTVDDFETLLEEKFGLHVQVFRKSGSQWMQTSATDHWTFNKHLQIAKETDDFLKSTRA